MLVPPHDFDRNVFQIFFFFKETCTLNLKWKIVPNNLLFSCHEFRPFNKIFFFNIMILEQLYHLDMFYFMPPKFKILIQK